MKLTHNKRPIIIWITTTKICKLLSERIPTLGHLYIPLLILYSFSNFLTVPIFRWALSPTNKRMNHSHSYYNIPPSSSLNQRSKVLMYEPLFRFHREMRDGLGVQSRWAYMPRVLLRNVLARVEASEATWPQRKSVVACAGVCRNWRRVANDVVKPPELSAKITFPISLKHVLHCSMFYFISKLY